MTEIKTKPEGGYVYRVAVRYAPSWLISGYDYRPRKRLTDKIEVRAPNASAARERTIWLCEYELGRDNVTVTSCRRK